MFSIFCFKLPFECKSKDHQDQASVCAYSGTVASSLWNFPSASEKEEKGVTLYYVKLVGNSFTTCQWIKLYYRVTSEINTGQKQDYPTFTMKVMKKPSYEKKYSSINTIHSFIRKTSHRMVKITICCCRLHTKRSIALEVTGLYFFFPSRHSFFLSSSLFQSLFSLSSPILYIHLVLSV